MSTESPTPSVSYDHIKAPNWKPGGIGQASAPVISSFRDFHLSDEVYEALDAVGYEKPTPVQAACTPLVLAGLDLIVQAQTGTGKTAAFALPTVEMLEEGTKKVEALILAPTRELARQVGGEFERLASKKDLPVACVYGGTGFGQQLEELKTAQVVCATPGRLLDLLKRKAMTLDHLKVFILDEADEMLNMGFEKEVTAIVDRLPAIRQSLLFSATITEDIKRLSGGILDHPEYVTLSSDGVAAEEVHHCYYNVTGMGRLWDLNRVIDTENPESAIVFCNTREDSFLVANFLKKQGELAEVLNGDLPQKDREATLLKLREGNIRFLVATDVAARGIDISDLSHVLNYTLPESPETYIHRTGRTGRAGKQGVAISLISPREIGTYYILRRVYKLTFEERELPTPEELVIIKEERAFVDLSTKIAQLNEPFGAHLDAADRVLSQSDAREVVARLLALFEKASGESLTAEEGGIDEAALRRSSAKPRKNGKPARAIAKPAVKAKPAPEPEPEVVEAAPEPEAVEAAPEPEAAEAAPEATEEEERPRRRRRRRRKPSSEDDVEASAEDAAPAEEAAPEVVEAAPEPEAAKEEEEPRRRRRRGRGRGRKASEETPVEEAVAAPEPEAEVVEAAPEAAPEPEATEEPPPRRRRRRRSVRDPEPEAEVVEAAPEAAPEPEVEVAEVVEAAPEPEEKPKPKRKPRARKAPAKTAKPKAKPKAKAKAKAEDGVAALLDKVNTPKEMETIRLNVGKNRFEEGSDVVALLCKMAGMGAEDFGDVTLRPRSSHVEARRDMVQDILEAIQGQDVEGITLKPRLSKR